MHYRSRRTIFCCASFKWHNRGIFVSTVKRFFSVSLFSDIMGHILAFNKPLIRGIEYPFKKVFLGKKEVLQRLKRFLVHEVWCNSENIDFLWSDFTLHWLPMEKRVIFKVLLLSYKALTNLAPVYISNLLVRYEPSRNQRSTDKCFLRIPQTHYFENLWGQGLFSCGS